MWLPVELPLDLSQAGVPIESAEHGLAWSARVALAIVDALRNSTVAIVSGEVFRSERVGLVPVYTGWSVDRLVGETASDFAARSRAVARKQIELDERASTGDRFYALTFTSQQDAA